MFHDYNKILPKSKYKQYILYSITLLIDLLVFPIELYFSEKRMVKLIMKRQEAWEAYKMKVRFENSNR